MKMTRKLRQFIEHEEFIAHRAERRRDAMTELGLAARLWYGRASESSSMHGYEGSLKDFLLHIAKLRRSDAFGNGALAQGMCNTWEKIIEELEAFDDKEVGR